MKWDELIPTRDSLLSRLKDWGDDESWRDFFHTYWRLIYSVALKSGLSASEAEEVVQATTITVAKNIHTFQKGRAHGSFKGWLLKSTRWRINDQFRKRSPIYAGAHSDDIEELPDPGGDGLESVWDQEWEMNLWENATERVRRTVEPQQYQLFDLHAVQGWPAVKVAQQLGVTANQVYHAKYKISQLVKAQVAKLRQEIK